MQKLTAVTVSVPPDGVPENPTGEKRAHQGISSPESSLLFLVNGCLA